MGGSDLELFRRFAAYLHRYRVYAVAAVLCIAAETVFELVIPLLMADIVDVGVVNGGPALYLSDGGVYDPLRTGLHGFRGGQRPLHGPLRQWPGRRTP